MPVEEIDAIQAARDLAALVEAMQQVEPQRRAARDAASVGRRDHELRHWLARFDGDPRVTAEWERALAAPPWDGPPVWHHGDLDVRNWLVRDGRIGGVIDWGAMGVGDPACDVMVAWKLHSPAALDAFRAALPVRRRDLGAGTGLGRLAGGRRLAYYTPENNPALYHEAEAWLTLVLSESDQRPSHK